MTTRETILETIKKAVHTGGQVAELPECPEVWRVQGKSQQELLALFGENLETVAGKLVPCAHRAEVVTQITARLHTLAKKNFSLPLQAGIMPQEECLALAEAIQLELGQKGEGDDSIWKPVFAPSAPEHTDPMEFQSLALGIVPAEYLLADTGTAVIRAASAFARMLCYLVPVCFIVAKQSTIKEHLPHAWTDLKEKLRDTKSIHSGEFLLMTGPSRTADIEKILVLGVHGPREVIVFVIQDE